MLITREQDAVKSLNSMLQHRAPRDPPPPRRSKRTREEEHEDQPRLKKSKADEKVGESIEDAAKSAANTLIQASLCQTETVLNAKNGDEKRASAKSSEGGKVRKKRELNVGESSLPAQR